LSITIEVRRTQEKTMEAGPFACIMAATKTRGTGMDETVFLETVQRAWVLLREDLRALGPVTGRRLIRWFGSLRGPREPWRYLTDVRAFPLLRLPWYAQEALDGAVDRALQQELIRSSMAGYLHIRLIDDSTDRESAATLPLLPALGPLHLAFEEPYRRLFPGGHPFFEDLRRLWLETSEATLRDGLATAIDAREYRRSSARKTRAALIPVFAVLPRAGRTDRGRPGTASSPTMAAGTSWRTTSSTGARTWPTSAPPGCWAKGFVRLVPMPWGLG
jgi:hypothetical protein